MASRDSEFIYGRNAVIEALRGRRQHRRLYVALGADKQERIAELLHTAQERGVSISRLHARDLDRLVVEVNHQGVVLETGPYPYVDLDRLIEQADHRPMLFLDHVQDPQNLGTLLRTSEATGVAGVVIPDRRSAAVTPAVVNASSGAVEHLQVARVTNLSRALEACKVASYWIVALEHRDDAHSLFTSVIPEPTGLLVGSEGKGIGPALLGHCDLLVSIPMIGNIASLNAAVAGSIALYELLRRRAVGMDKGPHFEPEN